MILRHLLGRTSAPPIIEMMPMQPRNTWWAPACQSLTCHAHGKLGPSAANMACGCVLSRLTLLGIEWTGIRAPCGTAALPVAALPRKRLASASQPSQHSQPQTWRGPSSRPHLRHEARTRDTLQAVRCMSVSACTHADRPTYTELTELCATTLQALEKRGSKYYKYTLCQAWESASNDTSICSVGTDIGPHRRGAPFSHSGSCIHEP